MDCEKLIALVYEKSALWDMRNKQYHQRDVQRKLWAKVGEEMDCDVEAVKKKWQNLRDIFRKEFNKVTQRRSGDEASLDQTTTWQYFKDLLFLKDVMKPRKLSGSISPNKRKLTQESEDEYLNEKSNADSNIMRSPRPEENYEGSLTSEDMFPPPPPINVQRNPRKKSKKENIDEKFLEIEKEKLKLFAATDDSDVQFLLSLSPFLKRVPPHRKLSVRHKLQEVFINEEQFVQRTPLTLPVITISPTVSTRPSTSSGQQYLPSTSSGQQYLPIIHTTYSNETVVNSVPSSDIEVMPLSASQLLHAFPEET